VSEITASVVLYNTSTEQLKRLLNCISESGLISKVYLIDNSPVFTSSYLFELPFVHYIKSERNLGYGSGHNIALRKVLSKSEFHFVLNPDIYFQPQALQKMVDRIIKDGTIGQLMPKIIHPDGSLQYLCKLLPTPIDLLVRRFFRGPFKAMAQKKAKKFELRFTGYRDEMDVPYLSGCFMLFRTSALKIVGLFDEQFFMYPEDIDITRRMHAKFRTLFFPSVTIVHDHAKESYKSKKMLWIHLTNLIKYFNKWGWFFDEERKKVNAHTLELLRVNHNDN